MGPTRLLDAAALTMVRVEFQPDPDVPCFLTIHTREGGKRGIMATNPITKRAQFYEVDVDAKTLEPVGSPTLCMAPTQEIQ